MDSKILQIPQHSIHTHINYKVKKTTVTPNALQITKDEHIA